MLKNLADGGKLMVTKQSSHIPENQRVFGEHLGSEVPATLFPPCPTDLPLPRGHVMTGSEMNSKRGNVL